MVFVENRMKPEVKTLYLVIAVVNEAEIIEFFL